MELRKSSFSDPVSPCNENSDSQKNASPTDTRKLTKSPESENEDEERTSSHHQQHRGKHRSKPFDPSPHHSPSPGEVASRSTNPVSSNASPTIDTSQISPVTRSHSSPDLTAAIAIHPSRPTGPVISYPADLCLPDVPISVKRQDDDAKLSKPHSGDRGRKEEPRSKSREGGRNQKIQVF